MIVIRDLAKEEAERVASQIVDKGEIDQTALKYWLAGAHEKILKLETKVKIANFNFWVIVFFIFILPILIRIVK
jgi:hypothetical protein